MIDHAAVIALILQEEREKAERHAKLLGDLQALGVKSSDLKESVFPELSYPVLNTMHNELRDIERGLAHPFKTVHVGVKKR